MITYTSYDPANTSVDGTLSNNNLTLTSGPAGAGTRSLIAVNSGKWYWECTLSEPGDSGMGPYLRASVGIGDINSPNIDWAGYQNTFCYTTFWMYDYMMMEQYGTSYKNQYGDEYVSYGSYAVPGDIIGVALDLDAGTLEYYKNGVSMGVAFNNIPTGVNYYLKIQQEVPGTITVTNFGATSFAYPVPTGFNAGVYVDDTPPTPPEPPAPEGLLLGGTSITQLYLGSTSITKAYLGNILVFGGTPTPTVDVLVVGGGGGSSWGTPGYCYGPGGAGGTVRYVTGHAISNGTYAVVVGAGGTGTGIYPGGNTITSGGDSSFDSIIATGGAGVSANSATGASNADYAGGAGGYGTTIGSGGGAGAGGNGAPSSTTANGGIGVQCDITGTMLGYGGGGGGLRDDLATNGIGVDGGGNAGSQEGGTSGVNGRGGGGGGRSAGGNGGSGVVIIAYPTGSITATGGTVTTAGGKTIHTFTTSGNFVVGTPEPPSGWTPGVNTLAYYKLDGDMTDSSGNGYNGAGSVTAYPTGKVNQAATFASGNYVNTQHNFTQFAPGQDFTISMLFKCSGTGDNHFLFSSEYDINIGYRGFNFRVNYGDGNIALDFLQHYAGPRSVGYVAGNYADGVWHHLVVAHPSGDLSLTKCYVDGVEKTISGLSGTLDFSNTTPTYIGARPYDTTQTALGDIDEVIIEDKVWNATDVSNYYNEFFPLTYDFSYRKDFGPSDDRTMDGFTRYVMGAGTHLTELGYIAASQTDSGDIIYKTVGTIEAGSKLRIRCLPAQTSTWASHVSVYFGGTPVSRMAGAAIRTWDPDGGIFFKVFENGTWTYTGAKLSQNTWYELETEYTGTGYVCRLYAADGVTLIDSYTVNNATAYNTINLEIYETVGPDVFADWFTANINVV